MNGSIVDSSVGKLLFPQESIGDTGGCRRRESMFMAAITTTKLLLLLCLFALLALATEMMPLQAQSAGTSCGVLITLVYMVCENYFLLPFYCKVAIFKNGQKIRYMMQFGFIIKLVCCLGWLCGLAFGQAELSETLTGSVTFPALGITCIGNLAVFYRCILRGPPKLDIGAKDVLTTVTAGQKLRKISDFEWEGLTTRPPNGECHVVMLSNLMAPNSSMQQFMEYMSNVHNLNSVFLPVFSLPSAARNVDVPVRLRDAANTVEICTCNGCSCILFDTLDEIAMMLAHPLPGILRRLSASQFLLPCESCLSRGCHGCNQGLLRVGDPQFESPAVVCSFLEEFVVLFPSDLCICIPVHSASDDVWTKQLITLLELKGNNARGRISVSSALKNYIAGTGKCTSIEEYNIFSLIIVPMLTEVLINIALTFWFKADGFSSALLARRAMEDYLPGHSGGGFSPIAFLTRAVVKSSDNNSNVFQGLRFRGSRLSLRPLYFIMGFVNLICSISWIVLVALEGGANKWYHTHSQPLSKPRVIVIIIAISFSLGMGLSHLLLFKSNKSSCWWSTAIAAPSFSRFVRLIRLFTICMIVLEILCIVSWSTVLGTLGMKPFGRWLYAALQCLCLDKVGFC